MKPLHQVLADLLRQQPETELPVEDIAREAWPHIAGVHIARRTRVFRLYKQTLIVHVPDKIWKQQLHGLEGQLVDRVNQLLGHVAISRIEFREDEQLRAAELAQPARKTRRGRVHESQQSLAFDPPRKGPGRELSAAAEKELADSASAIADPELRELFIRASRKMMK